MLKIGVLGAGHLGKIHLKCLLELKEEFHLVSFFDADAEVAAKVTEQLSVPAFGSVMSCCSQSKAVDIVTPTTTHFELAEKAIAQGKHVFY
ncbi:MAG: Gfo/Idh/MocA family oxidoreductase [Saprospiraceae bacterium]